MSATGPADKAAVRVLNRNSCGSGSVCGHSENGSYVLTNAHVAGTDLGRVVKVNTQSHGEFSAKVIMAGYSDRIQMDWAILHIDNFQSIEPVRLSMEKPRVGNSYYTKGSPRCVWPLVSTNITPVDMSPNSALWRWRPNAIGGQSGSGVWSDDNHYCYGLLTWSWGGLGAGQQTAMIYDQYRQAMTGKPVLGIPRWEGLIELPAKPDSDDYDNGPEYTNPSVSEGVFLQTNVSELPIWVNPSAPDPEPEPEPGPDPEPNPDPNPGEPSGWKRWTENHLKKQIALLTSELKSLGAETDPEPEPEPNPTPEPDDDGCIFGMPPLE